MGPRRIVKITGDPGHEFLDVTRQLCGPERVPHGKLPNAQYPPINMSGFVADYQLVQPKYSPQLVMDCQDSNNLPILNQLATEFMVCDHWFAAHPGPTWPNRFFIHAASATGQADSPSGFNVFNAFDGVDKYTFHRGTIYDALARKHHSHQIYIENKLSQVVCIGNQTVDMNVKLLDAFEKDIGNPDFPHSYVFIEPNSGEKVSFGFGSIGGGTEDDMHPPSDIRNAEALVKRVYEGLRNSPLWDKSVLVITFDEHGGLFDHVPPPKVPPLDDGSVDHTYGFRYDQLGVRVPALIISPWVRRNSIDHTVYEHSSIIASVVRLFGLEHLTSRDRDAADFLSKLPEKTPRTDAPARLRSVLDDSNVTHISIPEVLAPGQTGEVAITYVNTGATVWTKDSGYKLIDFQPIRRQQQTTGKGVQFPWLPAGRTAEDESKVGDRHDATVTPAAIELPSDVAPGKSVTLQTLIKAPGTPGCLVFQWGMTREGIHDFGQRTSPLAVIIGTSQPQLDEARLSFQQSIKGRDTNTIVEASLHDESRGVVASWKSSGQAFAEHSITNWFQMSPDSNLGRFAECAPRFMSVGITPNEHDAWVFAMYLMLNWTGGCSMFVWDMLLSDQPDERQREVLLETPVTRIAFKVPDEKGAQVQGVTILSAEAKLANQLSGIEFAMDYINTAGKHALFSLGVAERTADETFELSWDSTKKIPGDRNRNIPDVTLMATAVAEPASKLWAGRDTPRALLPVRLG
jgi:hypothetical protein